VKCAGFFEVQVFAGALAILLEGGAEGVAICFEKGDQAHDFGGVFFLAATGKARRETHFHFRIEAAGKRRIAANFDLAAADFEKVEDLAGEIVSRFAGGEGSVVGAAGWSACCIDGNAAGCEAPWVRVAQIHFKDGGRTETHELLVTLREEVLGVLIVGEGLLELGAGDAVTDALGKITQTEALGRGIQRAEEAIEPASEVLGANEEWLGGGIARKDQADGGVRRQGGEEIGVGRRSQVGAAIEFEHEVRILGEGETLKVKSTLVRLTFSLGPSTARPGARKPRVRKGRAAPLRMTDKKSGHGNVLRLRGGCAAVEGEGGVALFEDSSAAKRTDFGGEFEGVAVLGDDDGVWREEFGGREVIEDAEVVFGVGVGGIEEDVR